MDNINLIQFLANKAEYECRPYCGSSMYGRSCLGVVCENPLDVPLNLIEAFCEFESSESNVIDLGKLNHLMDILRNSNQDSLGMDYIVYWPQLIIER